VSRGGDFMGLNSTQKMRQYRERLKASGLRPIQLWVPDVRSQKIIDEVRRQSVRVSSDSKEPGIMKFVESVMDTEGWE
ncbi:MAG: antitoxin MazE family protein, partial [Desulfobacterales bacterium]